MKNFKRIKNDLKATNKKQELNTSPYFCVSHTNQNISLKGIKSNLPKNQYLVNPFANIITKESVKFPLETYTYKSKDELIQEILTQNKNVLGFLKVDSHLFLKREVIKKYNFTLTNIYSKINSSYLNVIKLTALLKHFSTKNTNKVA